MLEAGRACAHNGALKLGHVSCQCRSRLGPGQKSHVLQTFVHKPRGQHGTTGTWWRMHSCGTLASS
eukprot:1589888-Alexandrium_andersonii.AAC.1